MESNFVDFEDQSGVKYLSKQPRTKSFVYLAKKTHQREKKGEKEKKRKN